MLDSLHSILTVALDLELAKERKSFEERLNACLMAWSGLNFCTFATAFEIQGKSIRLDPNDSSSRPLIYGRLQEPKEITKRKFYDFFTKLIGFPERSSGRWPWNIMRDQEKGKKSGIFPPKIITIKNSLPYPLWTDEEALNAELNESFQCISSNEILNENSWKWYAEFPALLGDLVRTGSRVTKHLVYILGTRREFVIEGGRDRDFGLIVGLTERVDDSLKQATNLILAAWNLMVVAEHIIEDADRIAALEAARSMSHTFRTFVESSALPAVRTIIRKVNVENKVEDEVAHEILDIGCLAAFMGFVSRKGILTSDVRPIDVEPDPYNPLQMILKEFKKAEDEDVVNIPIKLVITEYPNNPNIKFVNKIYLRAICHELIKNIRDHGKKEEDGKVHVTLNFSTTNEDQEDIQIMIINPSIEPPKDKEERNPIRGLRSLKSMVEACGGKYDGRFFEDDKSWKTHLVFDSSIWSVKTQNISLLPPRSETTNLDITSYLGQRIKKDEHLESPALRILLLDDELAEPKIAERSIINLGNPVDWICYTRKIKECPFFCFGNKRWQIELLLCRSVFYARDYLINEKFDICLIDVDFNTGDPERGSQKIPSLGGILPALVYCRDPLTYLTIFTAKDSELRDDANYYFLREMSKTGTLGNLEIEDLSAKVSATKELSVRIPEAIVCWMEKVLPKRFPDAKDASLLVDIFLDNEKPFDGSLKLKYPKEREVMLPYSLFGDLLTVRPQDVSRVITQKGVDIMRMLSVAACGHQLVRHTVCKIGHVNDYMQNCCVSALFNGQKCQCGKQEQQTANEFTVNIDAACKMFGVQRDILMNAIGYPLSGAKVKRHTRIDIAKTLGKNEDSHTVLFGIFIDPEGWMKEFKKEVESLIGKSLEIKGKDYKELGSHVKPGCESESRTRVITIQGQRDDKNYISDTGGSISNLANGSIVKLCKIASDVKLLGPCGTFDMRSRKVVDQNISQKVCLQITVQHSRATEG